MQNLVSSFRNVLPIGVVTEGLSSLLAYICMFKLNAGVTKPKGVVSPREISTLHISNRRTLTGAQDGFIQSIFFPKSNSEKDVVFSSRQYCLYDA